PQQTAFATPEAEIATSPIPRRTEQSPSAIISTVCLNQSRAAMLRLGQLAATTYTYDPFGRQSTATDARNGTTSFSYYDDDTMGTVATPVPGNGQAAQTTLYIYDQVGRITRTALPDGTDATNQYAFSGELIKTG